MFEKKWVLRDPDKNDDFLFFIFKIRRAKCIQSNHAKRLLGLFFIHLLISFYLNQLKFLHVASDSIEAHSPSFFGPVSASYPEKLYEKFFLETCTL